MAGLLSILEVEKTGGSSYASSHQQSERDASSFDLNSDLKNIRIANIGHDGSVHRQIIVSVDPRESFEQSDVEESAAPVRQNWDADMRVIEENDPTTRKQQPVVGVVLNFSVLIAGHSHYQLLIQLTMNRTKLLYQIDGILQYSNGMLVQTKSPSARKKLCRRLNTINSQLSFGAYYTDPANGRIGFRICPTIARRDFDDLLSNNDRLNGLAASDIEIVRDSFSCYLTQIMQVCDSQKQCGDEDNSWVSELLPVMDLSLPYNEISTNNEELRNTDLCERRIKDSLNSFFEKVESMSRYFPRITSASRKVDLFLGTTSKQTSMEEATLIRTNFMAQDLERSYSSLIVKPKQIRIDANDNIYISAEIQPKVDPIDTEWCHIASTTNSELRRQLLLFTFSQTNSNSEKVVTEEGLLRRHVVLKSPANIKTATRRTPNNCVVKRESNIVKMLCESECVQFAKFYFISNPQSVVTLERDRSIPYNDCVLMDYYTYKSLDCFMKTNSQTISSYTRVSLLIQTAQAVRFMKNIGMTHFDLKPSNILLGRGYFVKVTDLGEAHTPIVRCSKVKTELTEADMAEYCPGCTMPYASPEVFDRPIDYARYGHKIDVYSFGVLMMELLFDSLPISMRRSDDNHRKLRKALEDRTYTQFVLANVERLYYYFNRPVAEVLCYVALRCLDPDPLQRPCIDWVLVILRRMHGYIH